MFPAEQSGWERSPTHGPGADSQRIADGDMARPAGKHAEDTGSPAETTRQRRLSFYFLKPGCWAAQMEKDQACAELSGPTAR
jgi:hypothetical protein